MMMQAHIVGVVVHHHGSDFVNKSLLCYLEIDFTGEKHRCERFLLLPNIFSLSEYPKEWCLKLIINQLIVKRLEEGKWQ